MVELMRGLARGAKGSRDAGGLAIWPVPIAHVGPVLMDFIVSELGSAARAERGLRLPRRTVQERHVLLARFRRSLRAPEGGAFPVTTSPRL